jgi:hypothetical protein
MFFEETPPIPCVRARIPLRGRLFHAPALPNRIEIGLNPLIPAARPLAFTVVPHLQLINYRGCFCRFVGI